MKLSGEPVSSTRMRDVGEQFLVEALAQVAAVTYWPSRPAKGELLTLNWIAMVGSSMTISGSGCGFSTIVMVSPMVMPSTPAMATMSPTAVSVDVGALEAVEGEELGDLASS